KDQQRVKDQENVSEEYNSNVEMQECDRDKEDQTNKLEQSEEIIQERELTLEDKCRLIVDDIRSEEFGVGIKLDEAGQNLMQKQQERQGRSLQRLSKDLYSKETHFVLELIQKNPLVLCCQSEKSFTGLHMPDTIYVF
uniref:Uncharacterized protein n=1 Tax=Biomphalaria glabrata TaxID=6526 RepID=A0A2C9LBN4_BIOGL